MSAVINSLHDRIRWTKRTIERLQEEKQTAADSGQRMLIGGQLIGFESKLGTLEELLRVAEFEAKQKDAPVSASGKSYTPTPIIYDLPHKNNIRRSTYEKHVARKINA